MALEQDGNHIPAGNKFWPKADKKLVGDFYGELNTQKTLKLPKKPPSPPPMAPAGAAMPPPPPQQQQQTPPPQQYMPPPTPPPPAAMAPPAPSTPAASNKMINMGQDGNTMPLKNAFFPKAEKKVKGDFYAELNANNNGGHPLYNKYYPKADKRLKGNFYGELNTQITLKLPKKQAPVVPPLPRPEVVMTQAATMPPPATTPAVPAVVVPQTQQQPQA